MNYGQAHVIWWAYFAVRGWIFTVTFFVLLRFFIRVWSWRTI